MVFVPHSHSYGFPFSIDFSRGGERDPQNFTIIRLFRKVLLILLLSPISYLFGGDNNLYTTKSNGLLFSSPTV